MSELKNYWVSNKTVIDPKSPAMNHTSILIEGVANEVYAVIEAEKTWKQSGFQFHPEMSSARETTATLPVIA